MTKPGRTLVTIAILLLAINLRPVVNALGAVVPELRAATGLPAATTGLLLSLPTLAFAVMGLLAPTLAARVGVHRTVVIALVALLVGQLVRAAVPGLPALFAGSLLALAGIAVANVLMPGLVRLHFPDRIPTITAAYTTLLTIGGAAAAGLTIPLERGLGGDWRLGLGLWAGTAAIALIPWLLLIRETDVGSAGPAGAGKRLQLRTLARTRVAWALALYFGCQSMVAYVVFGWLAQILVSNGMTDTAAAAQVSISIAVGIPLAAAVPPLLGRSRHPAVIVVALAGCYLLAFAGLIVAPTGPVVLWSVLIGVGTGAFPLALTLIALRARTGLATTSLSAFTQCAGYLFASIGPLGFGLLFDLSGDWDVPLIALSAIVLIQIGAGLLAVRPRYVEDELPPGHGVGS
ncbi:MFS transporter [Nakamurella sp.]|uniref:MFS transporter n=1 Tax=Nakamurella sp. TaxID=1869182 RepID=UPI0037833F2A